MPSCHACGEEIKEKKPQRSTQCEQCSADVYVCLNCRHHDRSAPNECRETQAEWVRDKDTANFCGWFELSERGPHDRGKEQASKGAFENLFKK